MNRIRIAQIGTSRYSHGQEIFNTLKALPQVFDIAGYALPENEREKFPERMVAFDGYREMTVEEILDDPSIVAVTVETEEIYLTRYAAMAVEKGKHVHMEKPGSPDLAAFASLMHMAEAGGKTFHIGYMYRYNPYIADLTERVRTGVFGDIISVEAQMNCCHPAQARDWEKNFPGGVLFFLGCHLIDLIVQLKGMPDNVIPLSRCTGLDGVQGEDFGMAVFEYARGVSFAKVSSVEKGGYARRQLIVTGTEGTVDVMPLERAVEGPTPYTLQTGYREVFSDAWHDDPGRSYSQPFDRYKAMLTAFAAMVRGEMQNPWSCEYELQLFRVIMEACGVK